MKKLPLGQQDFEKIIKGNYLYVDKTRHIFKLIDSGTYYFLSRPSRFGKSLLISTLKELFSGKKVLFKGLWIEDKIEWKEHPVIHISFNTLDYKEQGLRTVLNEKLDDIASEHGVILKSKQYSSKFQELIKALAKKINVVILIDEYDKPIIDYIDDLPTAEENREILKNFYSIVKDSDAYIRFFFITGVSKFSKVSVFSDLNNLNDITVHGEYSLLTGISHSELLANFGAHINEAEKRLSKLYTDVLQSVKDEYLGYSWDGENFVYNPFSILSFFDRYQFGDFWFQSGTPTFLIKLLKQENYTAFDLENKKFMLSTFDKFEINDISLVILLFQTGYLTIKEFEHRRNIIKLVDTETKSIADYKLENA